MTQLRTILAEKDALPTVPLYRQFWEEIYGLHHPDQDSYLFMEVHGRPGSVSFHTALPDPLLPIFERSLVAVHPAAELTEEPEHLDDHQGELCGATCDLDQHFMFPLAVDFAKADPMTVLCSALGGLQAGEAVTIQYAIRPVHLRHLARLEHALNEFTRTGVRPVVLPLTLRGLPPVLAFPVAAVQTLGEWAYTLSGAGAPKGVRPQPETLMAIRTKLDGGCLFDVAVRVLASAPTAERADTNLSSVVAALAPLANQNRWQVRRTAAPLELHQQMMARAAPPLRDNLLCPVELATALHLPAGAVPFVRRLTSRRMPVPEGVHTYQTLADAQADNAIVVGEARYRGTTEYVGFKNLRMLMQHFYAIGATGSGKTTMLQTVGLQTIRAGAGLTFFDVKGDAVRHFMGFLTPEEWERVVYIDLSQDTHFLPFNVMKFPGLDPYDLASLVVNVFLSVFGEASIQARSQKYLRDAVLAVREQDPDGSLLEVYRMLTDGDYRGRILRAMAGDTEFPDVARFWEDYDGLSTKQQDTDTAAIKNKLEAVIRSKKPKFMLCQKELAFSWRQLMDNRAIVLVNLDIGSNEPTIQRFFGTLFTALIRQATFSRSDIPREEDRVPHIFILDEFEEFTAQDSEFGRLLALARSYGLGLALTHQSVKQLDERMLSLIADNTFTQIALNIGDGSAPKIKYLFPGFTADDLTGLLSGGGTYEGVIRMKKLNPQPFSFCTLPVDAVRQPQGLDLNAQVQRQYARYYRPLAAIKADILARYRVDAPDVSGRIKKPPISR